MVTLAGGWGEKQGGTSRHLKLNVHRTMTRLGDLYDHTNDDLCRVVVRFNSKIWRLSNECIAHCNGVYIGRARMLEYYTAYKLGQFQRRGTVTVPQAAIDVPTVDGKLFLGAVYWPRWI